MKISKGLYEVITSKNITLDQKAEAIRNFAIPIKHFGGELDGLVEAGEIAEEDAELIISLLKEKP